MVTKFILAFSILALVLGMAGSVPGNGPTYKITLLQPSVVNGTQLKPGDYRISLGTEKVTISSGKQTVEVNAKVENAEQKFESTAVRYTQQDGKAQISEIRIGGTKTKVIFN